MPEFKSKDPLHGVTLEQVLSALHKRHGWSGLAQRVPVRCFQYDPSLKSSLTFLRKTPWARAKVEELYRHLAAEIQGQGQGGDSGRPVERRDRLD